MQILDWSLNAFGAFGGFFALLLGVFELFDLTFRRALFALTLLLVGILQLSLTLTTGGVANLAVAYAPIVLLIAPLAYGSILSIAEDDFGFRPIQLLSIAPGFGAVAAAAYSRAPSMPVWTAASCACLIVTGLLFKALRHVHEGRTRLLIAIFLMDFLGIGMLFLLAFLIEPVFYKIAQTGITSVICLLYFVKIRFPETPTTIRNQVAQARYARSRLNGLDRNQLLSKLTVMMQSELYADDSVTLSAVAKRMELTPHQLSELINREFQLGFFSFVNSFRIQAAKDLLLATEKSVIEIAFEVGFNNKSSFNEAFLKFTRTTPGQYRKNAQIARSNSQKMRQDL